MTSRAARILALSALFALHLTTAPALAHSVVVDGAATDWSGRLPNGPNLGIVARSATSTGELVFFDARLDARTDLSMPETGADMTLFAVTADRTNLYFLIQLGVPGGVVATPPQIQIAIDVDRVAGSGMNFLAGFADTTVASRWEFLVQTRGLASARIIDTTFATVAPATAAFGAAGTVEIAVPWSVLGAVGVDFDALRFSVATFREQLSGDTVDIGGPTVSNALDVVTDYADPGLTANTFAEVSDTVLDYSLEAWFERGSREVYAPLQIVRFMSDAPVAAIAPEWVEIRNQTPFSFSLAGICIGDEETPDGGESMQCLSGTLASGATAVIAVDGTTFNTAYGARPQFEETATDATVPDTTRLVTWTTSGGAMNLANTGDELLLLGFGDTILDLVTWGGITYPGITPRTPVPGANRIATRVPVTSDTDDCTVDFPDTPDDCGPMAGTCGLCRACSSFACGITSGAACDDGNACTTGTTCTVTATCTGGAPVSCDDLNQCTMDSCVPASGCSNTPTIGAACDDGQACTITDRCIAGIAGPVCSGAVSCDDMNPCTADACGPTGACTHTPTVGVACNDGNACTGPDTCSAAGTCGGAVVACPSDGNVCTTEACAPATGCSSTNNTLACDDGDGCTVSDLCGGGMCGGSPRVCSDANACTTDSCAAGACVFTPATGTACDDGNACTMGDVCSSAGVCAGSGMCDAGVDAGSPPDAGVDAGMPDTGVDAGGTDAGGTDASGTDAGEVDGGVMMSDAGDLFDGGMGTDTGTVDGGTPGDTGPSSDTGPRTDIGPRDAAGAADAGPVVMAGGCACRATSRASGGPALLLMLGLAAALVGRRR